MDRENYPQHFVAPSNKDFDESILSLVEFIGAAMASNLMTAEDGRILFESELQKRHDFHKLMLRELDPRYGD